MRIVILCLLVVLGLCTTAWSLDPRDPALVGLWLCDEGKGKTLVDSSGNKNDATGSFDWDAGKFGGGIMISAGSIDVVTSDSVNSIKKALTVAAWFRIDAASDTGIRRQNAFLLEDQSASEPLPDGFSFRIWTTKGLSPGIYGKTTLTQKQWYHLAGTYDGVQMKLYINGVAEKEVTDSAVPGVVIDGKWSGDIATPADLLQLKYGAETFVGAMDEIVIFNRALSADEIKQLAKGWKASLPVANQGSLSTTWGGIKSLHR